MWCVDVCVVCCVDVCVVCCVDVCFASHHLSLSRKVRSEYDSNFRSPLCYRYQGGVWVKAATAGEEVGWVGVRVVLGLGLRFGLRLRVSLGLGLGLGSRLGLCLGLESLLQISVS